MSNQRPRPPQAPGSMWERISAQIASQLTREERNGLEFTWLGNDASGFSYRASVSGPHEALKKMRGILEANGVKRIG